MKITVLGGASITWMPVFLKDLCACKAACGSELCLFDIDKPKLDIIRQFGEKMLQAMGKDMRITLAEELDSALIGADFVIHTVLQGSHSLWAEEMHIIRSFGIEHPKGMSVGPGGLAMSLRQIPWTVHVAQRMEKLCPRAWLLNLSNPMQTITLVVERCTNIKYLGLCHGVMHTVSNMLQRIGEDESRINYTIGGVNHFEIITKLERDGEDLLERVAQAHEELQRTQGHSGEMITAELYRLFGGYPCNEDIHVMEFLPYYIHKGTHLEDYEQTHNFIETRIRSREARWLELQECLDGSRSLESVLPDNTEKLDLIIDGIYNNTPVYMHTNVTNRGYISNLPDGICVEVPVVIRPNGYEGVCIGTIPKGFAALSALHGAVQDLTVDAALSGDRHTALQALSLDPMCYTLTLDERSRLLDAILRNCKGFVHPGFF